MNWTIAKALYSMVYSYENLCFSWSNWTIAMTKSIAISWLNSTMLYLQQSNQRSIVNVNRTGMLYFSTHHE
jgi:hypothetical protein